jgi:AbrB family looped-hinge helix DNA binding protein
MRDDRVVEVGPKGRIVIPARVRFELGIDVGTKLALLIEDGALVLIPRDQLAKRLQMMFADTNRSLSEELLAERRAEAAAEAAEELREQRS